MGLTEFLKRMDQPKEKKVSSRFQKINIEIMKEKATEQMEKRRGSIEAVIEGDTIHFTFTKWKNITVTRTLEEMKSAGTLKEAIYRIQKELVGAYHS